MCIVRAVKIALGKLRSIINEVLDEDRELHRQHIAPDERLRKIVHNIVVGGLRDAINSHGPITPQFIGSASKRITPQLLAYVRRELSGLLPNDEKEAVNDASGLDRVRP